MLDTVYQNLNSKDPAKLFPMDGNDEIGDCTIAAVAHAITVYRGLLKTKKIVPQAAVEKLYYHLTGGPDTGLNELDVLNYWRANPVVANEILADVKIDPKNHTHVEQAIQLFGGVYFGIPSATKLHSGLQQSSTGGRPARCSMKATRSMPWPTAGTA